MKLHFSKFILWFIVLLTLTCLAGGARAAQRAFSFDGVRLAFDDVSPDVDVQFRSMRLNRALNQWNVEVAVSNKSARTMTGPLFLSMESTAGTSGVLQPDAIDDGKVYLNLSGQLGDGVLSPGEISIPRTLRLGFVQGVQPQLVTRVYLQASPVTGSLALTRSLDEAGHPLPSTTVDEFGPEGSRVLLTDPSLGVVTLGQGLGEHVWRFSAPGRLPVWRRQVLVEDGVTLIPNPRLALGSTNSVTLTPIAGGVVSNALNTIRVTFSPGAISQNADIRLTALTGQTLPGLLPLGWSPLQAGWIDWTGPLSGNATLRLIPWGRIELAEAAVLVRWNGDAVRWEAMQVLPGNLDGSLTFSLSGPGAFALVVADAGTYAPPAAVPGQPLQGTSRPVPGLDDLTAGGTVAPSSSTASRNPELVTATASVNFTNTGALPSGLLLRCEVQDVYELNSGTRLTPPLYDGFIAGYQRPGDLDPKTLSANFPLRPLVLRVEDLTQAMVTVDVLVPGPFRGGILTTNGGGTSNGTIRIFANAWDFPGNVAVELRQLDPDNFSGFVQAPQELVTAFELQAESLPAGERFITKFPPLSSNTVHVLARVLERSGLFGLEPVERFRSDAIGQLTSVEPPSGDRLPGVTGAGQFVLVRLPQAQSLIQGITRDAQAQPKSGVPIRINGQPWLTFSGADGRYQLLTPTGHVNLAVLDITGGSANLTGVVVPVVGTIANTDLSTVPTGPRILNFTPGDGATNVSPVTQVAIEFSKPVNAASLLGNGVQLLDQAGRRVTGALSLNLANTIATLLTSNPLASTNHYTVAVSTNVTDQGGRRLEGVSSARFITAPDAIDRRGAALTSYEPVDGQAAMLGAPGTAEANVPVILVNETSGRTTTVLSKPDGSFSNSIPAEVDDTLTAVFVNQNGTRAVVPVSRQLFADGSVGLFNSGGTLEATNENGVARFVIEAGSIEQKTVLKLEPLSLQDAHEFLGHVEPTNGIVLGAFKLATFQGSPLKRAMELDVPINPVLLALPPGTNPTNASFGLVIPRVIDGQRVFQLVDSMHYEEGRLVTHSPPFDGGVGAYTADIYLLPIMLSSQPSRVVHGRVYTARVDSAGNEVGNSQDLAGALVRSFRNNGSLNSGTALPGMIYAVSSTNGHYSLLSILPTLAATHPRFPGRTTENVLPPPVPGNTQPEEVNLRFSIPDSAMDIPPEVIVSHLPKRQDPAKKITVSVIARAAASDPTLESPKVQSVTALQPGDTVSEGDIEMTVGSPGPLDPPQPFSITQQFTVSSPRAAVVDLRISALDQDGNKTTLPYTLQFGGAGSGAPVGPIPGSDFNDRTGPRVSWSRPEVRDGTVMPGSPILIKFDEPIKTNILQQPSALTMDPSVHAPLITLSEDQTVLTLSYLDLLPNTDYKLSLGDVEDLYGNSLDQNPIAAGDQKFVLSFKTAKLASADLINPARPENEGVGAVALGHYGFVVDKAAGVSGNLLVYDLRDPSAAPVATKPLSFFPRDLALIPNYSFRYVQPAIYQDPASRRNVQTNDFTETLTRSLLAVVGGVPGLSSILRIYDITDPTEPELFASTQLGQGETLPNRIQWKAPKLAILEVGTPDHITSIDLQSYLVGHLLAENPTEYRKLGQGRPGRDDNLDGDYADPGEQFPLPPSPPLSFPGKEDSIAIADSTQPIRDFSVEERAQFRGALVLGGYRVDETGKPLIDPVHAVPAGYRTLLDHSIPVVLDQGFYPITNGSPRRIFTLFKELVIAGTNSGYLDLALISVNSPPADTTNHVLVLNLTNRLAPTLLFDIPIPRSPGITNLYSFSRRADGLVVLASDTNSLLIDLSRFGAAIVDTNKAAHTIVGTFPGIGGDSWTYGVADSGTMVSARVPVRPRVVYAPPVIEIVSFPEVTPFKPRDWLNTTPTVPEILERLEKRDRSTSLRQARFRAEDGYCLSTLKDINAKGVAGVHYYALVKTIGGNPSRDYIELALESLNWAGAALKKRGFLFPPVHSFSQDVLKPAQLDQEPGSEGAEVRSCRAWRLSSEPKSPLFDLYLSRPFTLVGESLTKQDLTDLNNTLERDILWSGHFLRVSLDPAESANPLLEPFVGKVLNGRYHPGASLTLPSLPGEFIQSPNPMPIRGGATIGLAGDLVGAHNSELIVDTDDLGIPGRRLPVSFGRHYSGQALYHGPFGRGWDFPFNQRLVELSKDLVVPNFTNPVVVRAQLSDSEYATNRDVIFFNGAGRAFVYGRFGTNPPPEVATDLLVRQLKWVDANSEAATNVSDYYLPPPGLFSPMFKFKDGRFATLDPDGTQRWFNSAGRLIKIYDRWETNSIELSYGDDGELVSLRSDGGTSSDPFRLNIGYFRNPQSSLQLPADVVTNSAAIAGRICRLQDYTGRTVDFGYDQDGNLTARRGIEVVTDHSPTAYGKTGAQVTRYVYSNASDPLSRKSLKTILGPNQDADTGGVLSVRVESFAADGPDVIEKIRIGDRLVVEMHRAYGNTARKFAESSQRRLEVKGPSVATAAGSVQTTISYNFDISGRPELTTVSGGGGQPLVTEAKYDTNGLPKKITYPEKNSVQYLYFSDEPTLRSRANLRKTTKDPGPRAQSPILNASVDHYDGRYNLPDGNHHDFNQKVTSIVLSSDGRSVLSVTKGGETETSIYNEFGLPEININAFQIQTRLEYTAEGFVEHKYVENVDGSDPLVTDYEYLNSTVDSPGKRGLPSIVTDPTLVSSIFYYDQLDRLVERVREQSKETFSYDLAGNLIETTAVVEALAQSGPRLRVEHYYYDDIGNLNSNRVEGVEVFDTAASLQPQKIPVAVLLERDDYYRVKKATQPGGEQIVSDYDFAGREVVKSLMADGHERFKEVIRYDGNGNVRSHTVHQSITTTVYDGLDRPHEINSPEGAKTTLTYDGNDNVLSSETTTENGATTKVLQAGSRTYDELDRVKTSTVQTEAGPSTTTFTYEPLHRRVIAENSLGAKATNTYETLGRKWSQVGPSGSTSTGFDPQNRVLTRTVEDLLGAIPTTTQLTKLGHPESITLAGGQKYEFTPEVDGRVMETFLPGATDPYRNQYSIEGLPTESTKPEGQTLVTKFDSRRNAILQGPKFEDGTAKGTAFLFDPAGFTSGTQDALQIGDTFENFDEYGNPRVVKIARDAQVGMTYDTFGRLTDMEFSRSFTSSPDSPHYHFDYDALNRITRMESNSGTVDVDYGKDGLPLSIGVGQLGVTRVLYPKFDTEGARTNLTYTDGLTVWFGRDAASRLVAVKPASGAPVVNQTDYGAGAMVTHRIMGNGRLELDIQYDENRRETNRTYRVNGPTVLEIGVGYELDDNGLVTARHLSHAHTTDYFQYDDSQRLICAVFGVTNGPLQASCATPLGSYARRFHYDVKDVMSSAELLNPYNISVPGFVSSATVDNNLFLNQCTIAGPTPISVTRTPDAAGNASNSKGLVRVRPPAESALYPATAFKTVAASNTFNELNQLVLVQREDGVSVANAYGPNGLRIRRTVTGPVSITVPSDLEYVYDGNNLIEIHDFTRGRELRARFYYGDNGDELLAGDFFDPGNLTPKRYYYLTDKLGSPMAIADATGNIVEYYLYDAWGEATIRPPNGGYWGLTPTAQGIHTRSAIDSPFHFRGQIYDEDCGLLYAAQQHFDPSTGNLLSRDVFEEDAFFNAYAAYSNNPVNDTLPMSWGVARSLSIQGATIVEDLTDSALSWLGEEFKRSEDQNHDLEQRLYGNGIQADANSAAYTIKSQISLGLISFPLSIVNEFARFVRTPSLDTIPILGSKGAEIGESTASVIDDPTPKTIARAYGAYSDAFLFMYGKASRTSFKPKPTKISYCFPAGTPIATTVGPKAIENLRVGDLVLTTSSQSANSEACTGEFLELTLQIDRPASSGGCVDLQVMRPTNLLDYHGLSIGDKVWLELDELGIHDWAYITDIAHSRRLLNGTGRSVLATITHLDSSLIEIKFRSGPALQVTSNHLLYSASCNRWVRAMDIAPGERLATRSGTISVDEISPLPGPRRVYSLEIEGEHCFYAGDAQILSHNISLPKSLRRFSGSQKKWSSSAPRNVDRAEWHFGGKRALNTATLPESSARTSAATGYHKRNGPAFWRQFRRMFPELISKTNWERISGGRSPRVDKVWLKGNGLHEMYLDDRLVHHHLGRGPWAAGIPEHFHSFFHKELHVDFKTY